VTKIISPSAPFYTLRQGEESWLLVFAGQRATFRRELGATYVAFLLTHCALLPLHALRLAALCSRYQPKLDCATTLLDPATSKSILVDRDVTLQQRSLSLDDDETLQALRLKRDRLNSAANDQLSSPMERATAQQEILDIEQFLHRQPGRTSDAAQRAVRAVRMAIMRFYRHLLAPDPATGKPDPVLVLFAEHLRQFLLIPSSRYSAPRARSAHKGLAGCFTFEPPPGITWTCSQALAPRENGALLPPARSTLDAPRSMAFPAQRFGSEGACREYLMNVRWPDGFRCPACGSASAWGMERGLCLCQQCRHQTSITAGTIFHHSRVPLTTWFQAMWCVASEENGLTALALQHVLYLGSYRAAWSVLHKLRQAMVRPGRDRLRGMVELSSVPWNLGSPVALVAAEQSGRGVGRICLRGITTADEETVRRFIIESIEPGSSLRSNGLSSTSVEGYVYRPRVPVAQNEEETASLRVAGIVSLLRAWLHKSPSYPKSREHLADHLNEFTFRFNCGTSASTGELFERLVRQMI
jgi:Transposase zinc-ribbon domain